MFFQIHKPRGSRDSRKPSNEKNSSHAVRCRRRSEVVMKLGRPTCFPILHPVSSASLQPIMLASLRKATSLTRVRTPPCPPGNFLTRRFQVAAASQKRFLSIHEYQSMNLLNSVCC